ncbi:unnamed protein product [Lactuca virosa]|uniref:Uncharacterized protein n=1 Tax=Lactuca virosa TaxID=75947 RepID=A0AAU9LU19_9ASTR|nr:unnamed protein product [Lactuca virosa]
MPFAYLFCKRQSGSHVKPTFHRVNLASVKEPDSLGNPCNRSFSPSTFQCNLRKKFSTELGFSGKGSRISGHNGFRVESTSSGGGSGGYGGSDSGSSGGGGGDGGGGDGDGGKKWSFVSWYLTLLEAHPVWTKAVTSALLTFVGDLICQVVIDQVSSLDLNGYLFSRFLGWFWLDPHCTSGTYT